MASLPLNESMDSAATVGISGGSTQSTLSLGTFWPCAWVQKSNSSLTLEGGVVSVPSCSISPWLGVPPAHAWAIAVRSQLHTAPAACGWMQGLIEARPSGVVAGCLLQNVSSATQASVIRCAKIDW